MTTKTDKAVTSTEGVTASILYTLLKEANAIKLSPKNPGALTYQIGEHPDTNTLAIRVTANDSGGYFSKEWFDVTGLEKVLEGTDKDKPFKSGLFKELFKGSSSNNAGFCAAVCRAEGLIKPAPDSAFLHLLDQPFTEWMKTVNKLKAIGTAENLTKPKENPEKASKESPDASTEAKGKASKNTSLFDQSSDKG